MNDRIRELLEQSLHWSGENVNSNLYSVYEIQQKEYEKFAELIVREVFAKIEDERFELYQPVKESVMKHFGVKQ